MLAECKLWRNPEARRQLVAQVIDYARCLVDWTYDDLEQAIANAQLPDGSQPSGSLWERVAPAAELEESAFIDALSRNLRLGRVLLLGVGDGIREGAESLADYLQVHAGLHFTLGLVELATYELPEGGGFLVQPRVLARTLNVERGVVRLDGKGITVHPPEKTDRRSRATSLSEETFYEQLGEFDSQLPARLRGFLQSVEPVGVYTDLKRSLILRWRAHEGLEFNLGYIKTNSDVWMDAVSWKAGECGATAAARSYVARLAELIGAEVQMRGGRDPYVSRDGVPPKLGELLDQADGWRAAIRSYTQELMKVLADSGTVAELPS